MAKVYYLGFLRHSGARITGLACKAQQQKPRPASSSVYGKPQWLHIPASHYVPAFCYDCRSFKAGNTYLNGILYLDVSSKVAMQEIFESFQLTNAILAIVILLALCLFYLAVKAGRQKQSK